LKKEESEAINNENNMLFY